MNKWGVLLIFTLIVIVGLFAFSSWTNAKVVSDGMGVSQDLALASNISPLLIGLFLVLGLAWVALISVERLVN